MLDELRITRLTISEVARGYLAAGLAPLLPAYGATLIPSIVGAIADPPIVLLLLTVYAACAACGVCVATIGLAAAVRTGQTWVAVLISYFVVVFGPGPMIALILAMRSIDRYCARTLTLDNLAGVWIFSGLAIAVAGIAWDQLLRGLSRRR